MTYARITGMGSFVPEKVFFQNQSTAQSNYNSLQLSLTSRFTNGLQFLASYTRAKSIDNASGQGGGPGAGGVLNPGAVGETSAILGDQHNNRANRGISDFDRKHRFVFSAVLHEHPAISSVALIGLPDPKWGEQPVAVVIVYKNSDVSAGEIIEFCSGKLARYKIPKQVFFVEEFPLLASGKVYKRVLKEEIEKILNGK